MTAIGFLRSIKELKSNIVVKEERLSGSPNVTLSSFVAVIGRIAGGILTTGLEVAERKQSVQNWLIPHNSSTKSMANCQRFGQKGSSQGQLPILYTPLKKSGPCSEKDTYGVKAGQAVNVRIVNRVVTNCFFDRSIMRGTGIVRRYTDNSKGYAGIFQR